VRAWVYDDAEGDPRLPHQTEPIQFVSLQVLSTIGVCYWKLRSVEIENNEELNQIRKERNYKNFDLINVSREKLKN